MPDKKARMEILIIHTTMMNLADDVNLEAIVHYTDGYAAADI